MRWDPVLAVTCASQRVHLCVRHARPGVVPLTHDLCMPYLDPTARATDAVDMRRFEKEAPDNMLHVLNIRARRQGDNIVAASLCLQMQQGYEQQQMSRCDNGGPRLAVEHYDRADSGVGVRVTHAALCQPQRPPANILYIIYT
jgi:hypothetical protein